MPGQNIAFLCRQPVDLASLGDSLRRPTKKATGTVSSAETLVSGIENSLVPAGNWLRGGGTVPHW